MESIPSENQRFKDWLDRQHRPASSVAKDLGVSRAVLSHILSGRNKLSLSVVQCAARAFDDFDMEYVVLGGAVTQPKTQTVAHTPASSLPVRQGGYDELILIRDGKFRVLAPEKA
jgi:transcriptional regulator with XRE-family HTH domain